MRSVFDPPLFKLFFIYRVGITKLFLVSRWISYEFFLWVSFSKFVFVLLRLGLVDTKFWLGDILSSISFENLWNLYIKFTDLKDGGRVGD